MIKTSKTMLIVLFFFLGLTAILAQDMESNGGVEMAESVETLASPEVPAPVEAAAPQAENAVPSADVISKQQTSITNPFDMRDPFKRNLPKRGRLKKNLGNRFYNGQMYTNIDSVEGIPLEQIRVVGVLLGNNRRAIVRLVDPDQEQRMAEDPNAAEPKDYRTFVVKEGMKLGIDGAEVRAILPGGIVLVEKIRNVYDQDEYLETIIPVSE